MTKIVITCNTAAYATSLESSIGSIASVDNKVVTIIFDEAVDAFGITLSDGQVRVDSITVTAEEQCKHTEVTISGTDSTCTATGLTDGKQCSICGVMTVPQTVIAKKDHIAGDWIVDEEATLEKAGLRHKECSVCGNTVETEIIPQLSHTHNYTTNEIEPTCTEKGSITKTCACGDVQTEEIAALGHNKTTHSAKAATCGEVGYNAYETCSRCDYSTKVEIPATGNHSIENGQCSVCGIFEITISFADKTNRTVFTTSQQVWVQNGITVTNNKGESTSNVADYANPARFYKNSQIIVEYSGMTKIVITCGSTSYATTCKNSIGDAASVSGTNVTVTFTEEVNSFEFSATQGQIQVASIKVYSAQEPCKHTNTTTTTVDATCTEAGSITVTCDDCGETVSTTEIPVIDHNYGEGVITAPTCGAAGFTTFTCSECGDTYKEDGDPATGEHTFDENGECTGCDATEGGSTEPAQPTTVTIKIQDYAASKNWENSKQYSAFDLDDVISISASTGGNNGKYYTSGYEWRTYQSDAGQFTITATEGKTIVSVKITYNKSNNGVLTHGGNNITSGTTVTVNANSITFIVGATAGSKGQAKITAIEVTYQ